MSDLIERLDNAGPNDDNLFDLCMESFGEIERLQARVEALECRRDWIKTDLSYKAPEQITVDLFSGYLDMMFGELAATEQEGET